MTVGMYYSIAASMLCFILFISLIIRKLTKGRVNLYFLVIVLLTFITSVSDILGLCYKSVIEPSPQNVFDQRVINNVFFLAHNFIPPFFLLYVSAIFGFWFWLKQSKKKAALYWIPYIVLVAALIVNNWIPIIFGYDENGAYYRGDYFWILYSISFIYIVETTVCIIAMRKYVIKSHAIILGLALPVVTVFAALQIVFPTARLEMLAIAIILFLTALLIHKPEENLDHVVNTQSYNAFLKDLKLSHNVKRPYVMLLVKIKNHASLRSNLGFEQYLSVLRSISGRIEKIFKAMGSTPEIYYLDNASFAIIDDKFKKDITIDAGRLVAAYLQEPLKLKTLEVSLDATVVFLDIPTDFNDDKKLLNFIHKYHVIMPDKKQLMMLSDYVSQKNFRVSAEIDDVIARAITNNNFKMYYQPIYSVKEKKFVSAEALIRLIDPDEGFVSPGIFIPAAEVSGAIHTIGDFVFEDVARFVSSDAYKELNLEYVEINLSVAQCIEANLVEKVLKIIEKAGVTPDKFNLEITETAVDYDPKISKKNVDGLHEAGFSFSLDDYGTGYSNITRVAKLPIEIVKIDKSIVDEMDNPKMMIIIENTVDMLKKLNKKILVEGIEEERALNRFVELGCDYIQGFYYSKPLPEDEFLEFVRKANC